MEAGLSAHLTGVAPQRAWPDLLAKRCTDLQVQRSGQGWLLGEQSMQGNDMELAPVAQGSS